MSPFQTWRGLFSHVSSHTWSCKAATLEYGYLKSAVAWYGTFTANVIRICDLVSTPTRHRVAFTFVVGDAVVEALRPVGRGGSVEGLHREGAGRRRLRPVFQRLFWRSKTKNHVVWRSDPSRVARRVSPPRGEEAYRRRGEDTDSLPGLWPATRPPLRRSHRTLLHCSYPAVPRSPLSWSPATKTALFIHTHTRPAVESSQARMTHHNLSTLINISKYQPRSSILSRKKKKKANEYTDNMQTFNSRWLTRRGCSTWLGFCYLQSLTSLTDRKIKSPR